MQGSRFQCLHENIKYSNERKCMEFFARYQRQLGYVVLIFLIVTLQGCGNEKSVLNKGVKALEKEEESYEEVTEKKEWKPCYELADKSLLQWEWVRETETEDYYIVEKQDGDRIYPQIFLKEGKNIFCGTEHLNYLLSAEFMKDYNILYADCHYISIWWLCTNEDIYISNINLQCPVTESFISGMDSLSFVQDDNDYRYAPWPSNGIVIVLDNIMKEIEKGNCYLDQNAYNVWKKSAEEFIESIRKQFKEIEEGGFDEAYCIRFWGNESKKAYRMYLREGRVGFYIHPINYWEKNVSRKKEEDLDDFRIEVAYDWQKDASAYHMTYEVYGQPYEGERYGESFAGNTFRTFYYSQVRGLEEEIQSILNENMEKDFKDNLELMTLDKWNERLKGYRWKWDEIPPINNPMVTYQTEKYLCIRQDIIMNEAEVLRYAGGWRRYHVYDLKTGKSLKLEDILNLDENFVRWLKDEKKVEARTKWYEGMSNFDAMVEHMKEDLEKYPDELLLSVLKDAEFWMKDGSLYVRLPYYDQKYGTILYTGLGTDSPSYICYAEMRIATKELEEFLKVEPW